MRTNRPGQDVNLKVLRIEWNYDRKLLDAVPVISRAGI